MSYAIAVADPFNPEADGAQVPDVWSFPTSTTKVTLDFAVLCDDDGNCAFTVMPDLVTTIAVQNSLINTPTLVGGFSNQSQNTASVSNPTLQGVVATSALQAQYENYRIVGWGVQVRATQAPLNQQGSVFVAATPVTANRLEHPQVTTTADWLLWHSFPGTDTTGYTSTQIQNIPEAKILEYSALSAAGGVEFVSKHCTAAAVEFRDSYNNCVVSSNGLILGASSNNTLVQGVPSIAYRNTGVPPVAMDADVYLYDVNSPEYINIKGWSALQFRGQNLAVSGTTTNVLNVQVMFHLEGILPIAQDVGIAGFNAGAKLPPVNPNGMNNALAQAASLPFFRNVRRHGKRALEMAGRAERGVKTAIGYGTKAMQIGAAFGML